MTEETFVAQHRDDWKKLAGLISRADGKGLRNMTADELKDLGEYYRRAASNLAYMRTNFPGSSHTEALNRLVASGHQQIYQSRKPVWVVLLRFYGETFPQVLRKNSRYFLVSAGLFLGMALIGFLLGLSDISWATLFASPDMIEGLKVGRLWTERIEEEPQLLVSSAIMTNNIKVTFLTFGLSAGAGIFTFYIIGMNGLMLGNISALCLQYHMGYDLMSFIFPHGTIELTVIFIAGAAGFMLADALIHPRRFTRKVAFRLRGKEAVQLVLGAAPFLVLAGFIEGFISPSSLLPGWVKIPFGGFLGIIFYLYLFWFDISKTRLAAFLERFERGE